MKRRAFIGTPLAAAIASAQTAVEDEYGGLASHQLQATGRFRIARWRGGRWLITPGGHPFSAVGLCHAQIPPQNLRVAADTTRQRFDDDPKRYAEDLLPWMKAAGFNTFSYGVPAFTDGKMNRLSELQLVPGFINGPSFPDFFDPGWRAEVAAKIAKLVPLAARDPRVIGHVLSSPLLFSPQMERPRIWREGALKRQNYLMAVKALPSSAPGKKAYLDFVRGKAPDLSGVDEYLTLRPEDAAFYTHMWDDLTRFIVSEVRKHDPSGLIFSYRFIRVLTWPDPWLDAMLAGVGPHVDGFAVELYGDNPYRAIVDGIGERTGKPSLILDGMRTQEFVYSDMANDKAEAAGYEKMYQSLLGSRWFLGSSICEYKQKLPNNPFYSPRPNDARTGIRNPDYSDRPPLLATFRRLHPSRYQLRLASLRPDVSEVKARFRNGQTFLTWRQTANSGLKYRIYRSTKPITALTSDLLAATVDDHSSLNLMASINRMDLSKVRPPAEYVIPSRVHFVIADNEQPLDASSGLFVHTAKAAEKAYYAIAAGDDDRFAVASVQERSEPLSAIRQNDKGDYTHWTAEGASFNFRIHAPDTKGPHPLIGILHGALFQYNTNDAERFAKIDGSEGDTAVRVAMDFPLIRGKIRGITLPAAPSMGWDEARIARVLWTLDWVAQKFKVDRDQVSLRGESMGALGSITIALLHPERFAAIHAYVPPFGPLGAASRFNVVKELESCKAELPYILYTAGRTDQVVGWPPQLEFARAAERAFAGYSLFWDRRGHIYDPAFPAEWDEPNGRRVPALTSFSRRQSFPAISGLSVNSDPGTTNVAVRPAQRPPLDSPGVGDLVGSWNGWVEWDRTSIIDHVDRYEITLRLIEKESATANITPRRLQAFTVQAGRSYNFKALDSKGASITNGTAQAGANGLLTIKDFPITRAGTRLVIA